MAENRSSAAADIGRQQCMNSFLQDAHSLKDRTCQKMETATACATFLEPYLPDSFIGIYQEASRYRM